MQADLFFYILLFFIGLSTSLTVVILYRILTLKEKDKESVEAKEEEILKTAQTKANYILHQAIKGAHKIMIRSELAGIKKIADERIKVQNVEKEYREKLAELTKELGERLEKNAQKQQASYEKYVFALENSLQQTLDKSKSLFSEKTDRFFQSQAQAFTSVSDQIKEQIRSQIEEEMIRTKAAISKYEKSRVKMIDDNIAGLVEETTLRVLGKRLSLKDHADLVLQALEQAKKEGFFEEKETE